jgi:hypothetical protein
MLSMEEVGGSDRRQLRGGRGTWKFGTKKGSVGR